MIAATFFVYLLIMLGLGILAYRRTSDLADYILGGRRLSSWVTALSAQASDMSGWLLMGLPGLAYRIGLGALWMPLGLLVGTYLNWRFVAPRLRETTEKLNNALTIPDYFETRFNDDTRLLRSLAAAAILIFLTVYTSSLLAAGGQLFEVVFEIDYFWAVTAGAAAILVYTAFGGFLAVSWSDSLQGILMLFALIAGGLIGLWALGGFDGSADAIREHDPLLLDFMTGEEGVALGTVGIISSLAWGLGYFGQPHILVRFMAIREPSHLPRARRLAMGWVTVCLVAAVAVGMLGAGYLGEPLAETGESERVFMYLVEGLFHPIVAGACLAAILAAVMSTADSQLLVASSAVAEDFYNGLIRPTAGRLELMWVGRLAVVAIALIAFALAMDPESRVLDLVAYAWAGFGATFGPIILVSLWWPRMSRAGAACGIVVGAVTIFAWRWLRGWSQQADADLVGLFELYELVPGFTLSLLAIVLVSKLWPPRADKPTRFSTSG